MCKIIRALLFLIFLVMVGCSTHLPLSYKYHSENVFDLLLCTPRGVTSWEDSNNYAYLAAAYIAQERGFKYFQEGSSGGGGVSTKYVNSGCKFMQVSSTFTCFKNKPINNLENNNLFSLVRPMMEADLTIKTMETRYGENAKYLKSQLQGADSSNISTVSKIQPKEKLSKTQSNTITNVTAIEIQQRLKALGYPVGAVDGIFGPKTLKAIQQFQKDHGLKPDGFVGPETLKKLFPK